jgi:serine/threonine-protein phosphatase PGAM5
MATRYLYLVRHGNYESQDPDDELGGSLSALGREQADRTGEHFANFPITAIYGSTMRRAFETAKIISSRFRDIEVQPTRELWECIPTIPPKFEALFAIKSPELTPDKVLEQRRYADIAFDRFFVPSDTPYDEHILLVCHGNLIRYFICRVLDVNPNAWANMRTFQCGFSVVTIEDDDEIALISFNETPHLPEGFLTEL